MTNIVNIYVGTFMLIGYEANILECDASGSAYTPKYNYELSGNNNFIRVGSDSPHNWTEAETYCEHTFGSHLAAIHSLSENNDAFGNGEWYLQYGEMWIGLNDIDIEGGYSWIDCTSFDYENWFANDDMNTENCVGITSRGKWNDTSCSNEYYAFICRDRRRNLLESFTLDTSQTANAFGNITLVSNTNNEVTSSNTWKCKNAGYNSLCLYVTIFNSECVDIETITITTEAPSTISGDPDLFFVFTAKNSDNTWDFISFLAGWSGVYVEDGGDLGGVFVAPNCASTQLLNTDDIFTIWSDYNDGNMGGWPENRIPLSGYDVSNWELLTSNRLSDKTYPITITIENDLINNAATVWFSHNSIGTVDCTFNQAFDTFESGNDWIVFIMSDEGTVSYSEFTIEQECVLAPSLAPSYMPSKYPSQAPTSPSYMPSESPSQQPTAAPSANPTQPPTGSPSVPPTNSPSQPPTSVPSASPSQPPTGSPSAPPTNSPSQPPTRMPSGSPTVLPSQPPTGSPSQPPTAVPTMAPTMSLCDNTIQTNNTFLLCNFIIQFDSIFNGTIEDESPADTVNSLKYLLHSDNYCNVSAFSDYVVCDNDDSNEMIKYIYLNNSNVTGEMNDIKIDIFDQLMQQGHLKVLDLSNNKIYGSIDNWSPFGGLKNFSLANNNLAGVFDVESLISVETNSEVIDISNNGFYGEIEWSGFEYMTRLTRLKLGYNEFEGEIEIIYFENCEHFVYLNVEYNKFEAMSDLEDIDEYMPNIQELYINNNEIDEDFDVSYFSGTRDLKVLKCNNNSLRNGNMDMKEIPESLKIFDCGFNDFGEFIWDALSYGKYLLQYISLPGCGIRGFLSMAFFDNENGGYSSIEYLDLSDNENLNISIEFEYLEGQTNIYYLNLLNTAAYGRVDFNYLAQDKNITVYLSEEVWCVDSYCGGSTPYGYIRNNYYCYSKDDCEDTCTCDTAWAVGLEQFIESQVSISSFWVLIGVVGFLIFIGIAGKVVALKRIKVPMGRISDTFKTISYFGFVFQIWDFFSDLLLFENIFSHYQQASVDNPDRNTFERYLILSGIFIAVPFATNLAFLAYWKNQLSKVGDTHVTERSGSNTNNVSTSSKNMNNSIDNGTGIHSGNTHDFESSRVAQKWLQNHAYILVVLCVFSGSLTAALRMVNSNLFGMKYFNMGLSKYKQEDAAKHRLWLTILLENVPQICIAFGYALQTASAGFDNTVIGALASSSLSVLFALFAAFLSFPKHFYFHKLLITLKVSHNGNVEKKLGMKCVFKKIICNGLKITDDSFLIENVRCISNGSKKHIILDFVSRKPVFDIGSEQSLIGALEKASAKNNDSNNNNDNHNSSDKDDKDRVDDETIIKYKKLFNSQARSKKRDILKLLNKCQILNIVGGVSSVRFEFDRYECIELKNCSQKSVRKSQLHDIHVEMFLNACHVDDVRKYDVSKWKKWNKEMLYQWIEYKLKECVCKKEIEINSGDGDYDDTHDDEGIHLFNDDGTFKLSEISEEQIETFMQSFNECELSGIDLYTMRKNDSNLDGLKCDMELPKNLKKYWNDFKNIILNLPDMKNVNNVGNKNNSKNNNEIVIVYDTDNDQVKSDNDKTNDT